MRTLQTKRPYRVGQIHVLLGERFEVVSCVELGMNTFRVTFKRIEKN